MIPKSQGYIPSIQYRYMDTSNYASETTFTVNDESYYELGIL